MILTKTVAPDMIYYTPIMGTVIPAATTTYEVRDSSSDTVSLTLQASATATFDGYPSGGGMISVQASAGIASVLVQLGGTTPDGTAATTSSSARAAAPA